MDAEEERREERGRRNSMTIVYCSPECLLLLTYDTFCLAS